MLVIKPVRDRDEPLVPPVVARLVTSDEQERTALGIESVKHPVGPSGMLDDQFLHVGMFRAGNHTRMRPPQRRSEALQKDDLGVYVLLLILRKMAPPRLELLGVFDLPFRG